MPKRTGAAAPVDIARYRGLVQEKRGGPHAYLTLLGLKSSTTLSLLARVKHGLAFSTFERFRHNVHLSSDELASLIQISPRTLVRRREERRLTPEESDRLVRASRVFGKVIALFEGEIDGARRWLSTKAPALGGRTPLEVANTEVGAKEVEDLAGRLEHGVFS